MKTILFLCVICSLWLPVVRPMSEEELHRREVVETSNGTKFKKLSPNQRLGMCCRGPKVPKAPAFNRILPQCFSYCNFESFERGTLTRAFLSGKCNSHSLFWLLMCSSRWHNHEECCRTKGVPELCHDFCKPAHVDMKGKASIKYLPCADHIHTIASCFEQHDRDHPAWAKVKN